MSNEIQVFNNPDFGQVRATTIDGEPWLVGKDVATVLGYKNPQEAIRIHVDGDDKGVSGILTPGGQQNVTVINESGLYSLVLSSKMQGAKKFRRWVTADVLPSIRKHGMYATPATLEAMISDPNTTIKILEALRDERAAKERLAAKVVAGHISP